MDLVYGFVFGQQSKTHAITEIPRFDFGLQPLVHFIPSCSPTMCLVTFYCPLSNKGKLRK